MRQLKCPFSVIFLHMSQHLPANEPDPTTSCSKVNRTLHSSGLFQVYKGYFKSNHLLVAE